MARIALRFLAAVVLAAALLLVGTSASAEAWEGLREKEGVRLSRLSAPQGPPTSRAELEVKADLFEILAVLRDAPRRVEWMSRCVESRSLEELGNGNGLSYTRTRGVWPVADRDSAVRSSVFVAPDRKSATVRIEAVRTPRVPEVEGVVRIPFLRGEYRLRALDGGRTHIDYRISMDLGGRVPGFVESFVRDDMPFETLRNLRAQLARTRGEYTAQAAALREELPAVSAPAWQAR